MIRRADKEGVFAVTVRRPVAILMVTVAAVVFGVFSYRLLPIELMPDISYPSLTVRTEYPGAAPEEVEENVTRPVEEALGVVGGLVRIASVSRAGLSDVTLEFTWDTSMGQAWQEVTERLDTIFLPEDADKPLILRYDPALEPVLRLALASELERDEGPEGLKRLRTFAEQDLRRRLEQVPGVAAIRVLGGLEERVTVDLDESKLRRTGLSIQEVARRLEVENVNVAGGDITDGDTRYLVRTVNEFRGLEEIGDLVIARVAGRDVRLRDLGTVRSGWADRRVITRVDGREAIQVDIQKEADANVVRLAEAVRTRLDGDGPRDEGIRGALEEGWTIDVVSDRSTFIRASIDEVRDTAIVGGILAVCVLYLFLRDFRTTAVVSVAIPVSIAAVFAPMQLAGLSINIMSLGGLALGIGMLVDSGIVVAESVARCREEGDAVGRAVVRGTSEVGTAVVASTLTTVAVFFPMVFVEGVAGQVFGDLAATVVFALLASLLVSVFLVPALLAKAIARDATSGDETRASLKRRASEVLRYRGLGPLSDGSATGPLRAVSRTLTVLPILAIVAIVLRDAPGGVPKIVLGAIGVLAAVGLVTNAVARVARGRSVGSVLSAVVMVPLDAVLLVLEGAWLGVLWVLLVVGVPFVAVIWLVGRALGSALRPVRFAFDRAFGAIRSSYPVVLRAALRSRGRVLAAAGLAIVLVVVGFGRLDTTLIPEVHQGEFDVEVAFPVGTPLDATSRLVSSLERFAIDEPRVERAVLEVGADPDADSRPEEGEHTATLTVRLREPAPPDGFFARLASLGGSIVDALRNAGAGGVVAVREERLVDDLREVLRAVPEAEARITRPVLFSFRTPLEVEIEAYDLDTLRVAGERVRAEMASMPELADVRSTARPGNPEVQIAYDREAMARLGLDVRDVAELVRTKVRGSVATEYRKRERRIDVVVRLEEGDRATVRQLENLVVNPGAAIPIALSAVADVRVEAGPADIRRVAQQRVAIVQANVVEGGLGQAAERVAERLDGLVLPADTTWRIAGQVGEMDRSLGSLWQALALSVFLVYVVMASQFESLLHPLLIMLTVPLAFVGVVAVLAALSIPVSVVVFLGMIMLAGIVVNNAIVLVDYVNTLRGRGLELLEAVVQASSARLRPILMTTATTVLGLLPMALGLGDGAEIRTPMAITVVAGLLASTALTLFVLPASYVALESFRASLAERKTARSSSGFAPARTEAEDIP